MFTGTAKPYSLAHILICQKTKTRSILKRTRFRAEISDGGLAVFPNQDTFSKRASDIRRQRYHPGARRHLKQSLSRTSRCARTSVDQWQTSQDLKSRGRFTSRFFLTLKVDVVPNFATRQVLWTLWMYSEMTQSEGLFVLLRCGSLLNDNLTARDV